MKLYPDLRELLRREKIDYATVAIKIEKGRTYVSERLNNGALSFTLADTYAICDMLNEPYARIPELFPPSGKAQKKRPAPTPAKNGADPIHTTADGSVCIYIVTQPPIGYQEPIIKQTAPNTQA